MKESKKQTRVFVKTAKGIFKIGKCAVCGANIIEETRNDTVCTECHGSAKMCENWTRWTHRKTKNGMEFRKYNRYRGVPWVDGHLLRQPRNFGESY